MGVSAEQLVDVFEVVRTTRFIKHFNVDFKYYTFLCPGSSWQYFCSARDCNVLCGALCALDSHPTLHNVTVNFCPADTTCVQGILDAVRMCPVSLGLKLVMVVPDTIIPAALDSVFIKNGNLQRSMEKSKTGHTYTVIVARRTN